VSYKPWWATRLPHSGNTNRFRNGGTYRAVVFIIAETRPAVSFRLMKNTTFTTNYFGFGHERDSTFACACAKPHALG
jgi:hypothetical protein